MRRVIPVLFLVLGVTTLLILDTAEARGRRRSRRQCVVCCEPCFLTATVCPKTKMMSMGSMCYYYSLQYSGNCTDSVPVSYDTTDCTIPTPCNCGVINTCCVSVNYVRYDACGRAMIKKGDHVRHLPQNHHVPTGIPAEDSVLLHYSCESGTTLDDEFVVQVGPNVQQASWLKVGRFSFVNGSDTFPILVGYQVDKPMNGTPDIAVLPSALKNIPQLDYVKMLTISGCGARDGEYQIVLAH